MSVPLLIGSCGLLLAGPPPVWTLSAQERVVLTAPQPIRVAARHRDLAEPYAGHSPDLIAVGQDPPALYRIEMWGERFRRIALGPQLIRGVSSFRRNGRAGLLVRSVSHPQLQLVSLGRSVSLDDEATGNAVTHETANLNWSRDAPGFGIPWDVASLRDGSGHLVLTRRGSPGPATLHRLDPALKLDWRVGLGETGAYGPMLALDEGRGTCLAFTDRITLVDLATAATLYRIDPAEDARKVRPHDPEDAPAGEGAGEVDWAAGPQAVPVTHGGWNHLTAYWSPLKPALEDDAHAATGGEAPDAAADATGEEPGMRYGRGVDRSFLVEASSRGDAPPRFLEVDEVVMAVAVFVRVPTAVFPQTWRLAGTRSGKLLAFHGHELGGEPTVLADTGSAVISMTRLPNSGLVTTHFDGTVRFWALRDEVAEGEDAARTTP